MQKWLFSLLCFFTNFYAPHLSCEVFNKTIDVIIPCTDKDLELLEYCIDGIRTNCKEVRRVIVISDRCLTDKAEWFDESLFPFNKRSVAYYLLQKNSEKAERYLQGQNRAGWYFQQLLKLYAPSVIPGISSNILCLDSDTIFLKRVSFFDLSGNALYNPGAESHPPYFEHMKNLLPELSKVFPNRSGICHHMLMQKNVLDDLFETVEEIHKVPFWQAFCLCVGESDLQGSGASEYELYFNFAFAKNHKVKIRFLRWRNIDSLSEVMSELLHRQKARFHYVSCHAYSRQP